MSRDGFGLDQARFLEQYRFTSQQFDETGISWQILETIFQSYAQSIPRLKPLGDYIVSVLSTLPDVHSLKLRLKNPEHLIAKIIRKRLQKSYADLTADNYQTHVTDLIGVRALHLFKDQWEPIHRFVKSTWQSHELPTAYIRQGDPPAIVERFEKCECQVLTHDSGYRSVHYLIVLPMDKEQHIAELQVRTLFEEAWSEIDHQVRYPELSNDPHLAEFLTIFNRLAGSADEMGTFIQSLTRLVDQRAQMESELKAKEAELKKAISLLKISDEQKKKLEAQVSDLRKSSAFGSPSLSPVLSDLTGMISGGIPRMVSPSPSAGSLPVPSSMDGLTVGIRTCSKCGSPYQDSIVGRSGGMVLDRCPRCRAELGRP